MNSVLIITGGNINIEFARKYVEGNEFSHVIAVDGGLLAAENMGIIPDLIVGDFDTVSPLLLYKYEKTEGVNIIRYRPEKDFSDTYIAVKKAIELDCFSIRILGGTGTRLDHTIANIQLMQYALENGIDAQIISEKNRIRLLGLKRREIVLKKEKGIYSYKYVSMIPVSEKVTNVNTTGMKYNVNDYTFYINKHVSIGISNEILEDYASIKIGDGNLLVIESND
ncbi:MAG: thiamine diphosphokinase [Lachnospiraceae bacterium]|nr:thiamine diphosphokinase [Lachnospiraceae bacterium]